MEEKEKVIEMINKGYYTRKDNRMKQSRANQPTYQVYWRHHAYLYGPGTNYEFTKEYKNLQPAMRFVKEKERQIKTSEIKVYEIKSGKRKLVYHNKDILN